MMEGDYVNGDQQLEYGDGDNGMEGEGEEMMDLDDVPVTQEDAWAVIRYGVLYAPRRSCT